MKHIFAAGLLIFISSFVFASSDGGGVIKFQKRQSSAPMEITSVQLKEGGAIIMAEGKMGEYGKVYTTYELTADLGRSSGLVTGEGRGFGPDGSFAYASFSGIFHREDSIFTMHTLVRLNDGTQNLDKIIFDALSKELTHDVYVVR